MSLAKLSIKFVQRHRPTRIDIRKTFTDFSDSILLFAPQSESLLRRHQARRLGLQLLYEELVKTF